MSPPSRSRRSRSDRAVTSAGWWIAGGVLFVCAMAGYAIAASIGDDTLRGLVIAPIIIVLAVPLLSHARRTEQRFDLAGILFAGLAYKLLLVLGRFEMVARLYDGGGDSTVYHLYGEQFAPSFRSFEFDVDPGLPVPGTGFVRVLTGVVYALFGSDRFGGFLLFGFLSYLGCWFFLQAFRLAFPDGDHKRYAILVFFWPTLAFWPAAVGKEAWMILSLGLASWGASALYRRQRGAHLIFGLGVLGATMPRPHIAIVVLAAALIGLAMGSLFTSGDPARSFGFMTKLSAAVFFLVIGALLAPKVATFLNIDDVGGSGFVEATDSVTQRTSQGGSQFAPAVIESPLDYPWALTTVLFRPFPFEATSVQTLVSASEGVLLFGLLAISIRQLLRLPASVIKSAYAAFSAAFAFMFCYVFAFIANFGILARQRSQVLPFLFVLIAVPVVVAAEKTRRSRSQVTIDLSRPTSAADVPALSPPRVRA